MLVTKYGFVRCSFSLGVVFVSSVRLLVQCDLVISAFIYGFSVWQYPRSCLIFVMSFLHHCLCFISSIFLIISHVDLLSILSENLSGNVKHVLFHRLHCLYIALYNVFCPSEAKSAETKHYRNYNA